MFLIARGIISRCAEVGDEDDVLESKHELWEFGNGKTGREYVDENGITECWVTWLCNILRVWY